MKAHEKRKTEATFHLTYQVGLFKSTNSDQVNIKWMMEKPVVM